MSGIKNSDFKIGDKVTRTGCSHTQFGIVEGGVYMVLSTCDPEGEGHISLEEDPHRWYDSQYFELYVQPEVEQSPSELEEAYARIDSLEELVASLSEDRTKLLKAVKELLNVLDDNKWQLNKADLEGIAYAVKIYNKIK